MHIGCCHTLAIVNSAVANIGMWVSLMFLCSLDILLGVELLGDCNYLLDKITILIKTLLYEDYLVNLAN